MVFSGFSWRIQAGFACCSGRCESPPKTSPLSSGITSGPYNDLNVGVNNIVTVGSNPNAPLAYLSGTINQSYADNGAAGINVLRLDTGGSHTKGAIEFETASAPEPGTVGLMPGRGLLLLVSSMLRRQRAAARLILVAQQTGDFR